MVYFSGGVDINMVIRHYVPLDAHAIQKVRQHPDVMKTMLAIPCESLPYVLTYVDYQGGNNHICVS